MKAFIVDDSRIFRTLLQECLTEIGFEIVGSVFSGEKALESVPKTEFDLLILDLELPGINGVETLRQINANRHSCKAPDFKVIILSSRLNSEQRKQLEMIGVHSFLLKPKSQNVNENQQELKRAFLNVTQKKSLDRLPITETNISLILIGTSTGGPRALEKLLPDLAQITQLPILIVQHMPKQFTKPLAKSLSQICSRPVMEARDKEKIESGKIFLAPGGSHMIIHKGLNQDWLIRLNQDEPKNGCRPSVDVLFESAAKNYPLPVLALILTGMGCDGRDGAIALKKKGALILAQNEQSSVVFGMPASVIKTGVVDKILPLDMMSSHISKIL